MSRVAAILLFALVSATNILAEPLDGPALVASLDNTLDADPTARRATISLKVVDVESQRVLYDRHGDRLLIPASNLKIFTAACALDRCGPNHRFETRIEAAGPIDEGTLQGNLVLVGGGDAMLSGTDLATLADRVMHEMGVTRIEGRIDIDKSRYGSPLKGPGWMWDDDPDEYNMSVTPLMIDFNVLTLRVSPGPGGMVQAMLQPPASYPPICLRKRGAVSGPLRVTREPFTHEIVVAPAGPLNGPVERRLTMHDPTRWAAALFAQMLRDRGVMIADVPAGGEQALPSAAAGRRLVHRGVTLADTLEHFHAASENAVGEVLLHELAIDQGIDRPQWADGAGAISRWLTDTAGLESGSFRLVDGSGLSRYNLISADSAVRLLVFMHGHEHYHAFFRSLPTYRVTVDDITWPHDGPARPDSERVAAKSGGMTGVSTISGYVSTLDGRQLAFSLLANGFIGPSTPVQQLRQKVWQQLVQYRPAAKP